MNAIGGGQQTVDLDANHQRDTASTLNEWNIHRVRGNGRSVTLQWNVVNSSMEFIDDLIQSKPSKSQKQTFKRSIESTTHIVNLFCFSAIIGTLLL